MLIRVRFESLDGKDHDLEIAYDPQLYNDGSDDVGWTRGHALLAHDRKVASALVARPSLTRTSSGYEGHDDHLLEHTYDALRPGNVVQQAHTRLTGRGDRRDMTRGARLRAARDGGARDRAGVDRPRLRRDQRRLRQGLDRLPRVAAADPGRRGAGRRRLRHVAVRAQGARGQGEPRARSSPRRRCRGAGASCGSTRTTRARARITWSGRATSTRSPPRCIAAGDTAAANRALDFLFDKQQLDDGSFPQNTQVDGRPKWTGLQMDQVGLPIVLAWQLGRTSRVRLGPRPPRRRPDRRQGPGQRAGALGEPGGLLAGDDRGPDRGADLRRGHRAQERLGRARGALRAHGRLVGAQRRALDGDRRTARTRPSRTTCA